MRHFVATLAILAMTSPVLAQGVTTHSFDGSFEDAANAMGHFTRASSANAAAQMAAAVFLTDGSIRIAA